MAVIYVDFCKAFDTLPFDKILIQLQRVNVGDKMLNWFRNYFENRKIMVRIKNFQGSSHQQNSGVPQGSILGPLIFLIYVRSMAQLNVECKILQFADDTVLISSSPNIKETQSKLEKDFCTFQRWCHDFGLSINTKKTKLMVIKSPKATKAQMSIKNHDLNTSEPEAQI